MVQGSESEKVFVMVVPLEETGQIGLGDNLTQKLGDRLDDIRSAIETGVRSVAKSLENIRDEPGWSLTEVTTSFQVTLTTEAGVILSKGSAGATFEVTVSFRRDH